MRRLWLTLIALTACGPAGGASISIFSLTTPGEGEDVMKHLHDAPADRRLYAVFADLVTAGETYFDGTVQIPGGPLASRYVTEGQVIYQEQTAEGLYYWGSSSGDLMATPLVELSYPLKLNRAWTTGTATYPRWYQYRVEAVETVETPAGTFKTARVVMHNSRAYSTVTRWYADEIGLVQREAISPDSTVKTVLLHYQLEAK